MDDHRSSHMSQPPETPAGPQAGAELLSSLVLFGFGLFVFLSGIYMCFFAVTGTKVWYYSPGFFPAFIGVVLMLLSLLLFKKKLPAGGLKAVNFRLLEGLDTARLARLCIAVGLFAVYVFGLIGRLPFVAATFAYLSVTMTVFRTRGFPVWKILLISALTTALVYVFFGVIAAVPLP